MRLLIKTTPNTSSVDFEYQQKLVGTIHKWLGKDNELHGKISLYSFSWLHEGEMKGHSLTFKHGAKFFLSFYDEDRVKDIVRSILDDPEMFNGMSVCDVTLIPDPDLSEREVFFLGSPVFIHYSEDGGKTSKHITYEDESSTKHLTETLKKKMEKAGLPNDDTLKVSFDLSYAKKKVKLMSYRGIKNKASMCPVIIQGTPISKQFAWNVGIGNSTGIGFGSIY